MAHAVTSVISDSATIWTVAHLYPWDSPGKNTGVHCHALPSPGDFCNPGIEPKCLMSSALASGFFITSQLGEFTHLNTFFRNHISCNSIQASKYEFF